MDSFLSNLTSKTDHGDDKHTPTQQHPNPSSSELFSSAKIVADATKAKLANQEFDQAKAAGAAADILNAASQYGKLEDDKGLGKYVDKAEDYLRSYSQKTTTTTPATAHPGGAEHGQSGGGYGDYVKMAEGLLNKQSGDHGTASHGGSTTGEQHSSAQSEGGHGDSGGGLMKMAGDFLNKH